MRIELPTASWADTVQRADEDAHTLTLSALPPPAFAQGAIGADPALTVRTEVSASEPVVVTITF
jgi:hypothetical protein